MLITYITRSASPTGTHAPGDVVNEPDQIAKDLIKAGFALPCGQQPEKIAANDVKLPGEKPAKAKGDA